MGPQKLNRRPPVPSRLGFGSIIAAFHPVWSGLPVVLTLYGWSQVLKGSVYFAFPSVGLRKLEMVSAERSRLFIIPGGALLVFAGLITWSLLGG